MTWQPERYPENWLELAQECKDKAGWKCEECGIEHDTVLLGKKRGNIYKVKLTAAHLDHDPENPNPRLKALCQSCHLKYDRWLHGDNARKTLYRRRREAMLEAGQLEMFE